MFHISRYAKIIKIHETYMLSSEGLCVGSVWRSADPPNTLKKVV